MSVVMPVLNGERTIRQQLDSLAAQDYAGVWELVVSDNGSTDTTRAIVDDFTKTAPMPVRVADATRQRGISHARNAGVLAARGTVVAFCDCDDQADPGWVRGVTTSVRPGALTAGVNRELRDPHDPDSPIINPAGYLETTTTRTFVGCNFALTRADYLRLGGFDESLPRYGFDDTEFALRTSGAGLQVEGSGDMVMYFRKTADASGLMRKVYLSAKAEAVLWTRFPQMGQDPRIRTALRHLLALLPGVAGAPRAPKQFARQAVTRWGRLVGLIDVRLGRVPRMPRLIRDLGSAA
ncbi:glycosyltransferase family 2 protein [Aestuariimicrobium sp. Y1814]|uniref:glycosyltransferase family 2 protein n=1 Tax=Aestuariimicrobium sp. Y1814 TaxID=3418742 RepID=UPI003DA6FC9C